MPATCPYPKPAPSSPCLHIPRFILILFSHLLPGPPSGLFPKYSPPKPCIDLFSPPYVLHAHPSHSSRFDHPVTIFTSKFSLTVLDEMKVVTSIPKAVLYEGINQDPAVKPKFTLQLSIVYVLLKYNTVLSR